MLQASPTKEAIPLVCPGCGYTADDEEAMIAHWIRSRAFREKNNKMVFMPARDHTDPLDVEPAVAAEIAAVAAETPPKAKAAKQLVYEMPIADRPWWRRYILNGRYALILFNLGAVSFVGTLALLYLVPRIYLWYGAPWPLTILLPWGNLASWMLEHMDITLVVSIITLVSLKVGVVRTVAMRGLRLALLAFWCVVGVGFVALAWISFVLLLVWLVPKY